MLYCISVPYEWYSVWYCENVVIIIMIDTAAVTAEFLLLASCCSGRKILHECNTEQHNSNSKSSTWHHLFKRPWCINSVTTFFAQSWILHFSKVLHFRALWWLSGLSVFHLRLRPYCSGPGLNLACGHFQHFSPHIFLSTLHCPIPNQ